MYFPGDPLFAYDPIFNAVRDPAARELLVARFDLETTEPEWALGYRWDLVLGRGGRGTTPLEDSRDARARRRRRSARTTRSASAAAPQDVLDPDGVELDRAGCSTAPATRSPTA